MSSCSTRPTAAGSLRATSGRPPCRSTCQVGVRVIHPRIGLCDDDRIFGRETPRRGSLLVSVRGAASPVDELAGILLANSSEQNLCEKICSYRGAKLDEN